MDISVTLTEKKIMIKYAYTEVLMKHYEFDISRSI